ncbi:hypothetical protein H4J50_19300, partial [Colwellia sp. 6M3]|nr:hypothetical protein [Colwellia sp. 6M3]
DLKLRVYVTGGGCSGFSYGFTFDEKVNDGDMTIEKKGVTMVIFISAVYLRAERFII